MWKLFGYYAMRGVVQRRETWSRSRSLTLGRKMLSANGGQGLSIHTIGSNIRAIFESQLALFPRRTVECYMRQFRPETPEEALMDERNLVPMEFANLEEAWRWFEPLIQDEDSGQLLLD